MSITRTLATPLLGAAAAGVVLYSVGNSLALRTHQVTHTLHSSSHSLRRLADVDDTQDLLKQLHVAPDTATLTEDVRDARKEVENALPSAYQRPSHPSLTEQVKARWNEYLITFTHALSDTDADKIVTTLSNGANKVYSFATGGEWQPIKQLSGSNEIISSLRASAPSAPAAAATLREPVPSRHDSRLDARNTYYLGQGTSLR